MTTINSSKTLNEIIFNQRQWLKIPLSWRQKKEEREKIITS